MGRHKKKPPSERLGSSFSEYRILTASQKFISVNRSSIQKNIDRHLLSRKRDYSPFETSSYNPNFGSCQEGFRTQNPRLVWHKVIGWGRLGQKSAQAAVNALTWLSNQAQPGQNKHLDTIVRPIRTYPSPQHLMAAVAYSFHRSVCTWCRCQEASSVLSTNNRPIL